MKNFVSFFKGNTSKSSEFKSFFHVSLQDRPAGFFRKAREVWKVNPVIRRSVKYSKVGFAIGFIFYFSPGTNMPGQSYLRLFEIEMCYRMIHYRAG